MTELKRTQAEIVYKILTILEGRSQKGIRPTNLIQLSNLSPQMKDFYFSGLLRHGFMKAIPTNRVNSINLKITKKGEEYLKRLNNLMNELEYLNSILS